LTPPGVCSNAHHELAAHVSAIDYLVFVNGENYRGWGPRLTKHPTLTALVTACLGARVQMAPAALVVPLGTTATEAVEYLASIGLLARERRLLGFPHPSGANGWRVRQFAERRERLTAAVSEWASRKDAFLEAGTTDERPEPEPAEIDEGSVIAWATFGAAMAEATATLERTDRNELASVLDRLAKASVALATELRRQS
jgi:hypothetical protein